MNENKKEECMLDCETYIEPILDGLTQRVKLDSEEIDEIRSIINDAIEREIEANKYNEYIRRNITELTPFFDIRVQAFYTARTRCEAMRKEVHGLHKTDFLKEFGTLSMFLGRQTGNTYFQYRFPELLEPGEDRVAYVLPNMTMLNNFNDNVKNNMHHTKSYVLTTLMSHRLVKDMDYVVADCSYLMTSQEIDDIYKFAARVNAKMVLLL